MKLLRTRLVRRADMVAPSRGRGLKPLDEMPDQSLDRVAPSRGRGLKLPLGRRRQRRRRRPLTGARIETLADAKAHMRVESPLTGARIET